MGQDSSVPKLRMRLIKVALPAARVLSLALGSLALCASSALAQPGVLPRDLQDLASGAQCDPVPDFYSKEGLVDPPYVYGVLDGERGYSVAFWCVRRADRSTRLVIAQGGRVIRDFKWDNPPDGMYLIELRDVRLREWLRIDNWSSRGPDRVVERKRAIYGESEGVETYFVEVEGEWYFRILH